MDALLIASGVMTLLKPLLKKAGEKAAETIGEKLIEKTVEKTFWEKVKNIFIKQNERQSIEVIEAKPIASSLDFSLIEEKLVNEVKTNQQFANELTSLLNLSDTSAFLAEQLLISINKDKEKLTLLMDDRRLAGIGNVDQYDLEIRRVIRRMEKDEKEFITLVKQNK